MRLENYEKVACVKGFWLLGKELVSDEKEMESGRVVSQAARHGRGRRAEDDGLWGVSGDRDGADGPDFLNLNM